MLHKLGVAPIPQELVDRQWLYEESRYLRFPVTNVVMVDSRNSLRTASELLGLPLSRVPFEPAAGAGPVAVRQVVGLDAEWRASMNYREMNQGASILQVYYFMNYIYPLYLYRPILENWSY